MEMGDTSIHFWKCTEEEQFDRLELRKIDIFDDEMKDVQVKVGHGETVPFKIKRKDNYKLAGIVINKPFVQFTTSHSHVAALSDHDKLIHGDYYVSIFFTNNDAS